MPKACNRVNRNQLAMVVELKPGDLDCDHLAQAIGYTIAANHLFDISHRPPPVGVLTDLRDNWVLIWIGPDGQIQYAENELDQAGKHQPLSRITALHHIHHHMEQYDILLKAKKKGNTVPKKSKIKTLWAFDGLDVGHLKIQRVNCGEDNMIDVLENDEEVRMYSMHKRMRQTPMFDVPQPAEKLMSMYS
jgi:hypothetical protein